MKRQYIKPMISLEEMALDGPIAAGCDPNHIDEVNDLMLQGWFNKDYECNQDQYITDDEGENLFWDDNKLCYYSLATNAFTS